MISTGTIEHSRGHRSAGERVHSAQTLDLSHKLASKVKFVGQVSGGPALLLLSLSEVVSMLSGMKSSQHPRLASGYLLFCSIAEGL